LAHYTLNVYDIIQSLMPIMKRRTTNSMVAKLVVVLLHIMYGKSGIGDYLRKEAQNMVCEISNQEVKDAIFSIGDDKSPGPDGFTAAFFKEAWNIIANDVYLAVSEFFRNGTLLKQINHTIIALLPKGKWGLREGDSISPYLFTLVMEVLTLMLQRKVHQTDQFTYHRYCSKMKLVNLCFADDLFLFAYGDVGSASIIKEALDEFKFSKLSVKYFRVPFVSLRLMIRDCNELLDKVQIRIQDWKNKSLSIAAYETIPLESRIIG
nr:hypothetical protein [Tanacetum cinerariifolium]